MKIHPEFITMPEQKMAVWQGIQLDLDWEGPGLAVDQLPTTPGVYAEVYLPERGVRIGETGRSIRGKIRHDIRWFRSMRDGTAPEHQLRRTLPIAQAAKRTGDAGFAFFVVSNDPRLEAKDVRQSCERFVFDWVRRSPYWVDWNRQVSWR
ncbi:MAG: hypothetical protein R3197_04360 [Paracoccaceae bacterium]|nr:hypothetical protein [Paracoccaceae bacterium]